MKKGFMPKKAKNDVIGTGAKKTSPSCGHETSKKVSTSKEQINQVPDRLLTTEDVKELLKVGRTTVHKLISDKVLVVFKLGGINGKSRRNYFSHAQVMATLSPIERIKITSQNHSQIGFSD